MHDAGDERVRREDAELDGRAGGQGNKDVHDGARVWRPGRSRAPRSHGEESSGRRG